MANKGDTTGKEFEMRIAQAFRQIGAWKVEHDVEIAGYQIDIYVELETSAQSLHRIAIEAKDYKRPVGIEIISEFSIRVHNLRNNLKLIDEGAIVASNGFTKQARNAAKEHGLRLLVPEDLEAMVTASAARDPALRIDDMALIGGVPFEKGDIALNVLIGLTNVGEGLAKDIEAMVWIFMVETDKFTISSDESLGRPHYTGSISSLMRGESVQFLTLRSGQAFANGDIPKYNPDAVPVIKVTVQYHGVSHKEFTERKIIAGEPRGYQITGYDHEPG